MFYLFTEDILLGAFSHVTAINIQTTDIKVDTAV